MKNYKIGERSRLEQYQSAATSHMLHTRSISHLPFIGTINVVPSLVMSDTHTCMSTHPPIHMHMGVYIYTHASIHALNYRGRCLIIVRRAWLSRTCLIGYAHSWPCIQLSNKVHQPGQLHKHELSLCSNWEHVLTVHSILLLTLKPLSLMKVRNKVLN